jgi:hypothetical protein
MEDIKTFLAILSMLISIIGLLYLHFGVIMKLKDDIAKVKEDSTRDLIETNSKLDKMCVKTDLFWQIIEGKVVNVLKSFPTDLGKDILLDKLIEKSLTLPEAEKLRTTLDGEMQLTKDNLFAYVLVLARLEQLIYDLRNEGCNEQRMVNFIR